MRTHFLTNRHFLIKIITVFIFLFGITDIYSQDSVLLWQDFDTIKEKFKTTQKPIMLFLYSDDDLSNKMFETTFQNSEVNKYLNYLFYNIKFNVKSKESIDFFDGETYLPSSGNDYHNLVRRLYGDSISTQPL